MLRTIRNKILAAAISVLACSLVSTVADDATTPGWPAVKGAVFAQRNADNLASVVAFDTKGRPLLAFHSSMRGRALPGRFYELICGGGSFLPIDAGAWAGAKVAESGAFTIEVALTPALAEPEASGVVFAFGDDGGQDFALRQDKEGLSLTLGNAKPIPLFAPGAGKPVHVLIACGPETWTAYRDGKPAGTGVLPSGLAKWGTRQFVMGAHWSGDDPWEGNLEAIAVFPRALTAGEAAVQAAASAALRARRVPAPTVRFKGTLVRQAETSKLEEIRPYTRSLSFAEYKVDEVIEGQWDQPTIIVAHWMIMDSVRLPIADRKPGTKVELSVQPMDQHPQLASSRRDDISDGDLDAELFYCESETVP